MTINEQTEKIKRLEIAKRSYQNFLAKRGINLDAPKILPVGINKPKGHTN